MPIDGLKPQRRTMPVQPEFQGGRSESIQLRKRNFLARVIKKDRLVWARWHSAVVGMWQKAHLRTRLIGLTVAVLVFTSTFVFVNNSPDSASAVSQGDALMIYGASANTNPRLRTYSGVTNSFAAAGNTVAGAAPLAMLMRTSPTKQEAIAGYVNSGGVLQVMCFDGTTWTNEWTVTVGGAGTTRRFDISYETNTGDVVVLYSTNAAATNELASRTKLGSTGCGTANWAGAANFDPVRTSGIVQWVKVAWDRRGTSNLVAAAWLDASADLSSATWSGTAWGNEPSTASSTNIEIVAGAADVESFDIEYESASGDVMLVFGEAVAANVNGMRYRVCTGGIAGCTWGSVTTPTAGSGSVLADEVVNVDISAQPYTDEIVFASVSVTTAPTLQFGYWSGSAWTTFANQDTTASTPVAGSHLVTTGWLTISGTVRSIIVYADATATTSSISYYIGNGSLFTVASDFVPAPVPSGAYRWMDIQMDPYNRSRLILAISDANSDLYAKRLQMTSAPLFVWTNADGGSVALEANLGQAVVPDFSFAYWRLPAIYEQKQYHWYANANGVQPGSSLASENTAATVASRSTIARLRMNAGNSGNDLPASNQDFKLQYATSTNGPWTDVASPWCNATTPVVCNTNWLRRKRITFDNTASSSTLTSFPVLVKLSTDNFDFSKARADGFDIVFTSSSGATLNYEREFYDGTSSGIFWVNVPSLPNNNSTYITMYYGNAAASSDPITGTIENNTWNSNYKGVWHLPETPSAAAQDSTASNYDGTVTGMEVGDQTTGKIDGSLTFDGTTAEYIDIGKQTNLYSATTYTVSCWVKPTAAGAPEDHFFSNYNSGALYASYDMYLSPTNMPVFLSTNNGVALGALGGTALSAGTWYHLTGVMSGGNTATLYVNAQIDGLPATGAGAVPSSANVGNTAIGRAGSYTGGLNWPGGVDECRFANVALPQDWIRASYLSESELFNTFGFEEDQGGGIWKFYDNATPVDGTIVTTNLLTGSTSTVKESYNESNPTVTNPTAITNGQTGEWDFVLDPSLICNGTYYFRMVKADGAAFTTYTTYPQLTVNATAPVNLVAPMDDVLHHGAYFRNGQKQPYSCDWVSS